MQPRFQRQTLQLHAVTTLADPDANHDKYLYNETFIEVACADIVIGNNAIYTTW